MPKRSDTDPAALRLLGGGGAATGDPTPTPAPAQPPAWLASGARSIWERLAPHIERGALTPATAEAFAMLCTAMATYAEADEIIQNSGLLIAEGQDLVPNPALAIRERADVTISRWARLFGLTPDTQSATEQAAQPRTLRHLIEG